MAMTANAFTKAAALEFAGMVDDERRLINQQFFVPIHTRTAWDEAVAWLEAREAARAEWPWPERP